MKNTFLTLFIAVGFSTLIFTTFTDTVEAHPGRTDSNGGHYCRTNCASWGEVYGQWHSHSSYSSPSTYSNTYSPPSFNSTYVSSNYDCPSYGFAYLGSCYQLPANARQSAFSGFTCNYGYEKVGYGTGAKCLEEVDNGYYVGTTLYCNYGYEKKYSSCAKKTYDYNSYFNPTSFTQQSNLFLGEEFKFYYWYNREEGAIEKSRIASQCKEAGDDHAHKPYFKDGNSCLYCDPGSITDGDKESCYVMADVCIAVYGKGSVPESDGKCKCSSGFTLIKGQCKQEKTVVNTSTTNTTKSNDADLQKQINELLALIAQLQSKTQ